MRDSEPSVSRRRFVRTAAGATVVSGATGAAGGQETPAGTPGDTPTGTSDGTPAGTPTGTGEGTPEGPPAGTPPGGETHTVDMTDDLVFDPEEITVAPGDTVEWVNVGSIGHSVTAYADDIPADAEYFASGGFDSEDAARSAYAAGDPGAGYIGEGGTYEHTFEVTGDYEYFCIPHETAGMVGTVTVSEGGGQAPGDTTPAGPQVPGFAKNVTLALTAGLLGVLSMTYLFIKFGGDYSFDEG